MGSLARRRILPASRACTHEDKVIKLPDQKSTLPASSRFLGRSVSLFHKHCGERMQLVRVTIPRKCADCGTALSSEVSRRLYRRCAKCGWDNY